MLHSFRPTVTKVHAKLSALIQLSHTEENGSSTLPNSGGRGARWRERRRSWKKKLRHHAKDE